MMRNVPIPHANELAEGARQVCDAEGKNVLLLRTGGETHAIENRCPHRGAPLTGAVLKEGCIQCPWHGLRFNVSSGDCLTNEKLRLRKFVIVETASGLAIELPFREEEKAVAADVRTALVRYGATGQVGWFGTIHEVELHRGAQVIVESAIGSQLGEVLIGNDADRNSEPQQQELCGEIIRNASGADLAAHAEATQFAGRHFEFAQGRLRPLGHIAVEIEATLDRQLLVIWLVSAPDAVLGPEAVQLAEILGVSQVRFLERQAEDSSAVTSRYNGSGSRKGAKQEERSMKGPGLRQKHELDRVWECAGCHHRERSTGIQTAMVCPKCMKNGGSAPPFMKLVSSPPTAPRRTFEVFSNTPVPTPVVAILGEDTARIPKKQAMRQGRIESKPDVVNAAAAEGAVEQAPLEEGSPSETDAAAETETLSVVDETHLPKIEEVRGESPDQGN